MSGGKFATSICCMDGRIQLPIDSWIKKKHSPDYIDTITEPGMEKRVAEGIDVDSNGDIWVADSGNRIQKFASISDVQQTAIPEWIKSNSAWWADGQIDEQTFVDGIEFLVKTGIIQVN